MISNLFKLNVYTYSLEISETEAKINNTFKIETKPMFNNLSHKGKVSL